MLSRREILRIVFETAPVAALVATQPAIAGGLAQQPEWPEAKRELPRHDPIIMGLDHGYFVDPDFEYEDAPTFAQYYEVNKMDDKQRVDFYVEHFQEDAFDVVAKEFALDVDELEELEPEHVHVLDSLFTAWLDNPMEEWGFYENALNSEYWMGMELLEELGKEVGRELGLRLVEGDQPGSSFCGVRFVGDADVLNAMLYRLGINMRLEVIA